MKTAMKHINAIFAGVMFIAFFLPFISIDLGYFGSVDANLFDCLEGSKTIWVLFIIIGTVALAAANYIKQIAAYVKYINIAAPALVLLSAIIALDGFNYAGFGFWLILIASVLAIAVAVIKLLGLKGNPVFDAINDAE